MTDGALVVDATARRGTFEVTLTLTARPGEVVALLGPNGAGKSTMLRAIAGLSRVERGTISLGPRKLDAPAEGVFVEARARRLGVVFQDHRLFPHLRVIDNVAFGRRSAGERRAPARASAQRWLDRLGLGDLQRRYPRQLSGGQAQRVALARALACDPGALLLDEPLAALDVQTRTEVQGELRRHLEAFDGPAVVVTHDPIEALLLAQRLVVLEHGRVAQEGTPSEITARPLTPYVAQLVGMNLYAGVGGKGGVTLDGGGRFVVLDAPSGRVFVAVRPSSITVFDHAPEASSARNVWSGTLTALAPLGDRVRLTVEGDRRSVVDVTAAAVAELRLEPGGTVWCSVKATDLSVYPA